MPASTTSSSTSSARSPSSSTRSTGCSARSASRTASTEQFGRLGPDLLRALRRDFVADWQRGRSTTSSSSRCRPTSRTTSRCRRRRVADLAAQAAVRIAARRDAADPRRRGRRRPAPSAGGSARRGAAATWPAMRRAVARALPRPARLGCPHRPRPRDAQVAAARRQRVCGGGSSARSRSPAPNVEAQFKPYPHPRRRRGRPQADRHADRRISTRSTRTSSLAATNPSQAEQANANLQVADRQPARQRLAPAAAACAAMVNAGGERFRGRRRRHLDRAAQPDARRPGDARLRADRRQPLSLRARQSTATCRWPISRACSRRTASSTVLRENLAPMVDIERRAWDWKQDTRLGRDCRRRRCASSSAPREIRDAFFPTGGTMPASTGDRRPDTLIGATPRWRCSTSTAPGRRAQQGGANMPVTIQWPGGGRPAMRRSACSRRSSGRESSRGRTGAWAFMRLLDQGSRLASGRRDHGALRGRRSRGLLPHPDRIGSQSVLPARPVGIQLPDRIVAASPPPLRADRFGLVLSMGFRPVRQAAAEARLRRARRPARGTAAVRDLAAVGGRGEPQRARASLAGALSSSRRSGASGSAPKFSARPCAGRSHALGRRRRTVLSRSPSSTSPTRAKAMPPPLLDAQDAWFAAIEERLLSVLGPEASHRGRDSSRRGLPEPADDAAARRPGGAALKGGPVWTGETGSAAGELLASLARGRALARRGRTQLLVDLGGLRAAALVLCARRASRTLFLHRMSGERRSTLRPVEPGQALDRMTLCRSAVC